MNSFIDHNNTTPKTIKQQVFFSSETSIQIKVGYATVQEKIKNGAWMTYYKVQLPDGTNYRDETYIYPIKQPLTPEQMKDLYNLFEFIACRHHRTIEARIIKKQTLVITGKQPATTKIDINDYDKGLGETKKEEFRVPVSSIPHAIVKTLTNKKAPKTPTKLRPILMENLLQ